VARTSVGAIARIHACTVSSTHIGLRRGEGDVDAVANLAQTFAAEAMVSQSL
jgi:hypothetical protein